VCVCVGKRRGGESKNERRRERKNEKEKKRIHVCRNT